MLDSPGSRASDVAGDSKSGDQPDEWGEATHMVRGGLARSHFGETSEALFLNSGFVYENAETAAARFKGDDDGFIYSRYGNPTVGVFEERLRLIEGAEACFATASGMAAVYGSLACQLNAGDTVVASRALFGSCYQIVANILPRFGIRSEFVDGHDLDQWKKALAQKPRAVFVETPSNPTLDLIDLEAVCALARKAGARVVVDNVFATPVLQKPLEFGADIVVYSGTKHIDGQGRCLGGAILSTQAFKEEELKPFLRHTGPALSPFNAWVLLKGLETLKLRVGAQSEAAKTMAEALQAVAGVTRVVYPMLPNHPQHKLAQKQMTGGGSVITFEVEGGRARAFDLMNRLELVDISNNLGDAKSLVTHPASTTHHAIGPEARAAMCISEGMIRISVGLEEPGDILGDLKQAISGSAR